MSLVCPLALEAAALAQIRGIEPRDFFPRTTPLMTLAYWDVRSWSACRNICLCVPSGWTRTWRFAFSFAVPNISEDLF